MVLAACGQLRNCHIAFHACHKDSAFAYNRVDTQKLHTYGQDTARDEYAQGQVS
jgi:hypothetical protein